MVNENSKSVHIQNPVVEREEVITPFRKIISDYSNSLEALREFIENTGRVLNEKQELTTKEASELFSAISVAQFLTEDEDPPLVEVPEDLKKILCKIKSILNGESSDFDSSKREKFLNKITSKFPIKLVEDKLKLDVDSKRASETIKSLRIAHEQVQLIYESALMSLTSRSEWFIAQLMHFFYHRFEGALNAAEKIFSLRDLQEIGSIGEAKESVIESRVEDALRGPYIEWIEFFKKYTKIPVDFLDTDNHRIAEIFKRRNLFVHNGGIVSRKYLESVSKIAREDYQIGDKIPLPLEYLNESIDLLERNFLLIGGHMWKKFCPSDTERAQLMNTLSVDYLKNRRWYIVEGISGFVKDDNEADEYIRTCGQVNYWQAFKWSGRFSDVESDILAADYSAKDTVFRLAKLALLDDHTAFFKLLPKVLESDALSRESLIEWPLFQEMRLKPEMDEFVHDLTDNSSSCSEASS